MAEPLPDEWFEYVGNWRIERRLVNGRYVIHEGVLIDRYGNVYARMTAEVVKDSLHPDHKLPPAHQESQ